MSSTPQISIIVPIYKAEQFLPKCMDSLINQTLRDIEIICVNDGSPDNSLSIIEEYAKRDLRVVVIDKENGGLSSARNAGLEVVRGEYYMFVDSDDWLDKDTCEVAYSNAIKNNADCLMFTYTKEFGNTSIVNHSLPYDYVVWDKEQIIEKLHRRLFGLVGGELANPQDSDLIVTACMQLFKTRKYKNIRFVDTKIIGTEDCWYQILLYENCDKFVYIDKPYYHYLRINSGSLTTKYNPYLFERWQTLFDYMEDYILKYNKGSVYKEALNNRIALSILGAGINQAHSNDTIQEGGMHLRLMIEKERYASSLAQLNTKMMPIYWRFFFFLAKYKYTTALFAMLKIIEYLRTHRQ